MWHLIVPPIVVVACFVFVVWYLSLRGSDPEVAERITAIGDIHSHTLRLRARIFFLKVVEKIAQRFKLFSLQVYNGIHKFLQSVKEKRKLSDMRQQELEIAVQEDALQTENARVDSGSLEPEEDEALESVQQESHTKNISGVSERVQMGISEEQSLSFNIATPIRRRSKVEAVEERVVSPRPMVNEQLVRPEKLKRKVSERPAEEELIARIATNPKDYTAYEALGDFYMERGSIQDAKECYKQVLKLSPVQRLVKIKIRRLERLLSQR
ncbi:MAG: hypothetical protein KA054_00630 [Candidatus Moranbacteria bacterium]|nr:hypothetical protein [Candidatus Moranbacteria bacterium]